MFKTLINAWNVKDIRTKMLYTLLLVVIYRFGSFIPVPGVDASKIAAAADTYSILSFLNLLSGGNFGQFTIFAMGITPYITGSIIIQLLTIAIPSLEKMAKEEDGREKLERITRYTGIGLALVQSIGIVSGLQNQAQIVTNPGFLSYATIGIVCTAGTAFLVWLGERITDKGIGNGISFIIFASIVSSVPQVIVSMVSNVIMGTYRWWMYGGQSTNIPLKANANGVMPLIFAMTLMQVPGMIGQFWPNGGFYQFYQKYLIPGTTAVGGIVYYVIYALLIVAFAYFYSSISFNPIEISKNLQQNGGFIPGIRPGKPTGEYLAKICNRLTLFGAFFLMLIAIIPALFMGSFGLNSMFGPTSILIMVSVALETVAAIEAQMLMRNYSGFLEK